MSNHIQLHQNYVKGTQKKAIVKMVLVQLCHITESVKKGLDLDFNKIYLSTRVLKHVYDKRTAQEYDFLIDNLVDIAEHPNKIYKNKDGKRGSFCFVKNIEEENYLISIETMYDQDKNATHCEIVTFFRTNSDYLKNYDLLWEWKGGIPSS